MRPGIGHAALKGAGIGLLTGLCLGAIYLALGAVGTTDFDKSLGYSLLLVGFPTLFAVVPALEWLYDRYSFSVIPALGQAVTGDRASYRYLVESIRRFPDAETLAEQVSAAGFDRVRVRTLSLGIVALHSGWRL